MRVRDYAGPLAVLAAGVAGFSLLCSVSAMAMGDLNRYALTPVEPVNIVDLAVSNLSTSAAFTEQVVTAFVPTETLVPSSTPSLLPQPSDTATPRRFVTITPTVPRRTRIPPTSTAFNPTRTNTPPPTNTPLPTATNTPPPTATSTPIPTDTDTPIPPDTDTPIPPTDLPSDTPEPPPTETNEPAFGSLASPSP